MNLTNKVAIVTGGGQGIGEGICEILAKNGCTVIVTDLNSNSAKNVANKINSMNYKSISYQLDVTKHEESSLISQKVFDQFGKIDILINNAGIVAAPNWESKQKLTEDDWNLTFQVNLRGLAKVTESVIPFMKNANNGKIINIASGTVFKGTPMMLHYVSSKGAMVAFTRALAREVGDDGINVNAIAPGFFRSKMTADILKEYGSDIEQACPLGRIGHPEEMAGIAIYLASRAGAYTNGAVIPIDGGTLLN